jgi:hypothetical protein
VTYRSIPFDSGELEIVGEGVNRVVTLTVQGIEVMVHTPTIDGETGPMIEVTTSARREDSSLRVMVDSEVVLRQKAGHYQAEFEGLATSLFHDPLHA